MNESLNHKLSLLTLKMDKGLEAIDQLSLVLMALTTELQELSPKLQAQSEPISSTSVAPLVSSHLRAEISRLQDILANLPLLGENLADVNGTRTSSSLMSATEFPLVQDAVPPQDMHHKDILEDDDTLGFPEGGVANVPMDMQIRRLMAQLTAAYNRIAALEEQLLFSHRPSQKSHKIEV